MSDTSRFDAKELRQVLGSFVTGVTVVTTADAAGKRYGVTANSFSSVSLDPPLVLWSQATKSPSHPVFLEAPRFAINILAEDQVELSNRFASSGIDKFANMETDNGEGGVALLRDCCAWLECKVVSRLPGGDHVIFVGEIEAFRRTGRKPLVFGGGQYLVADPHDFGKPPPGISTTVQSQLHAMRLGSRAMARIAKDFDQTLALAVWGNHGPTIVAWEPSSQPVSPQLPVGLTLPVMSTATGVALAAYLPAEATNRFVGAELIAASAGDVDWPATPQAWAAELESVRVHGLARRTPGEFYGAHTIIHALSAPVLDANGSAVLAITAVGEASSFASEFDSPFAKALRSTASDLSRRLGYVAQPVSAAPAHPVEV
jgi:flavin reductase (DIM6/NTAB) family NADH-FMN oxidoreductase RutF/DNA-binding IclR family transcriptional regulator